MSDNGELIIDRLAGLLQDHLDLLSNIKSHIAYMRAGGIRDIKDLEAYMTSLREIRSSIQEQFERALALAADKAIDLGDLAALMVYYVESGVKEEELLLAEVSEYIDVSGDIEELVSWVKGVKPRVDRLVGGINERG